MAREEVPDLPTEAADRGRMLAEVPLGVLTDSAELALLRKIASFPRVVEAAGLAHEPHRIAFYLYELASEFHAQWTRGKDLPNLRFIIKDNREVTLARLALVQGVVTVLGSGLSILGVGAPEEMR
jgi:arginyl-tRNA synthetase